MWLKRIASVCFAIAFLMAIVLFAGYGRNLIGREAARFIFLASGATGLVLNLLSFRFGKHDAGFNFIYWLGTIILFIGLVFIIMHWPYGYYILLAGLGTIGLSFLIPAGLADENTKKEDLLDDDI